MRTAAIGCSVALCVSIACAHTDEVEFLSGAEIREFIVGNSLKEAESGRWREDYLPVDGDRLEGIIVGHQIDGIPYRGVWTIEGDRMCIDYTMAPDQNGCYRFSRQAGDVVLWFGDDGAEAFESRWIKRAATGSGAVEFAPPSHRQETLTFRHRENEVVGDLTFPEGSAPYPVVVFVHGSGPVTRHMEFLKSIGREFLDRGFATFIWSKPGVDESTGHYLKQTMVMRAEEVAAAMSQLAERPDIDGDRIGLWGISQAGTLARTSAGCAGSSSTPAARDSSRRCSAALNGDGA